MFTESKEIDGKIYVLSDEYNRLQKEVECLKVKNREFEEEVNHSIKTPDCAPISIAKALIDFEHIFFENYVYTRGFNVCELREIAAHLLVYCNAMERGDKQE